MPKISFNEFQKSKYFEPALYFTIGCGKTAYDYFTVKDKYKNKVLLNDIFVLAGASAGIFACKSVIKNKTFSQKIFKPIIAYFDKKFKASNLANKIKKGKLNRFYKPLETPLNYSKEIISNCISNVTLTASGFLGAILTSFGLAKAGLSIGKYKHKKNEELERLKKVELFMNEKLEGVVSKKYRDEAFAQVTDFKVFNSLTSSFIGLESLRITREDSLAKQLRKARKYLISDSLVPFFILSLTTTLTKKMKNLYRIPIIALSTVVGTVLIKQAMKHNEKH